MNYQLTDEANKDIKGILSLSIKNHGHFQAKQYFNSLKKCINLLANNPYMGRNTKDLTVDYYRFPHKLHIIFYKIWILITYSKMRSMPPFLACSTKVVSQWSPRILAAISTTM